MTVRIDRSATALVAAILLAYASVSDAQPPATPVGARNERPPARPRRRCATCGCRS